MQRIWMHQNWKLYFWLWNRANKRLLQESESWVFKEKTIHSGKVENKIVRNKKKFSGFLFLDFNIFFYLLSVDKIRISDEDDHESDKGRKRPNLKTNNWPMLWNLLWKRAHNLQNDFHFNEVYKIRRDLFDAISCSRKAENYVIFPETITWRYKTAVWSFTEF